MVIPQLLEIFEGSTCRPRACPYILPIVTQSVRKHDIASAKNMLLSKVVVSVAVLVQGGMAAPGLPPTTQHGTPINVIENIVNSWNAWQVQVNGSDATVVQLHEAIADNKRQADEAQRAGKRCRWNDGYESLDW